VTYRTRQVRHQSSPLTAVLLRADTAILSAFDLIEHDGEDMRNRPFLDRKNALARLLRNTEAGILFNEYIAQDGPVVFAHACWSTALACAAGRARPSGELSWKTRRPLPIRFDGIG
jgi:hypothetical protein